MNTQTQCLDGCNKSLFNYGDTQSCSCDYSIPEDFRITKLTYNEYTFELVLKQNPDVVKRIKIKSGITLEDLAHLNPVLYITDTLPLHVNSDANIVLKQDGKYYYYTWSTKFNRWYYFELGEGSEFYDLQTKKKYILQNNELHNNSTVDLDIEYTENDVTITNSQGNNITLNSATHAKAGLMNRSDKIKLDGVTSYLTEAELSSSLTTDDLYLKFVTYNTNTQESKEETFIIPVVTESKNGLITPDMKKMLETLYGSVIEIKPDFESTDAGLTYFYITKEPYTQATESHAITIPLVTENKHGLMSKVDKAIIDKFKFVYVNQRISEVYYDGVLLTNEKFAISRDDSNYYIKGDQGTNLIIEPYDPDSGKAGLLTRELYNDFAGIYTNKTPIVESWRGFKKKETFNNTSYDEILDKLLYPNIPPTIELLYSDPDGGVFEKESQVKLTLIEVKVTKKSHDISKIEVLDDLYNVVYTFEDLNIKDGGIFNINVPYDLDTVNQSEMYFRVRVTDTFNGVDEAVSKTFRFIYPYYYGISEDGGIDFTKLNKLVEIQSNKTLDFTSNYQQIVFGYPSHYGDLKRIVDVNGLDVSGFFNKYTKTLVTNHTNVQYTFYVSNKTTTDKFDITFKY